MKFAFLLFFIPLFAISSYSQEIQYGEPLKSKMDYNALIGEIGGKFFMSGGGKGKVQLCIVDEKFNIVLAEAVELEQDNKNHDIQDFAVYNDQLYVFTSTYDKRADLKSYFYGKLSQTTLELEGELVEFASEPTEKRRNSGYLSVDASNDQMIAFLVTPYDKNGKERFRFLIFDGNDEVESVDVEVPYPDRTFTISSAKFSTSGQLFVSGFESVYADDKRKRVSKRIAHVFSVDSKSKKITDYDINLGEDIISDMKFEINKNSDLLIAGFYSTQNSSNVKGMFYLKVDGESKKVSKLSKEEFSDDFIVSSFTDRQAKKVKKKADRKEKELELYKYDIDDLVLSDDGGLVLVAEQFYWYSRTVTDQNGRTRTTYYYVYNDVLVMKINPSGDIAWLTKVPKHQVTANDGGYYSSYAMMVDGDKIHLYYNDHVDNQQRNRSGDMKSFRFGKNGCITKATIYADGVVNREVLIGEKMSLFLRPKINSQLDNSRLLVYFIKGKAKQFGVIKH